MPDTTDLLQSLRDEAADFLATDAYFWEAPAVPVLGRIDKQQFNELQLSINTKLKLAVTLQIGAAKPAPNGTAVPGPFYDHVELEAHCFENRNLNDTTKTVERLSDIVAAVLQNYVLSAANGPLLFQGNDAMPTGDPGKVLRIVRFRAKGGLSYNPAVVATPVITNAALTVTITCATSGAAIYYTLRRRRGRRHHQGPRLPQRHARQSRGHARSLHLTIYDLRFTIYDLRAFPLPRPRSPRRSLSAQPGRGRGPGLRRADSPPRSALAEQGAASAAQAG
jgi:hypothetical protein